jgi:hypothetical protein
MVAERAGRRDHRRHQHAAHRRESRRDETYISLASKSGDLLPAEKSRVWKIEIIYSGELAEMETGLLTLSVLKASCRPSPANV